MCRDFGLFFAIFAVSILLDVFFLLYKAPHETDGTSPTRHTSLPWGASFTFRGRSLGFGSTLFLFEFKVTPRIHRVTVRVVRVRSIYSPSCVIDTPMKNVLE